MKPSFKVRNTIHGKVTSIQILKKTNDTLVIFIDFNKRPKYEGVTTSTLKVIEDLTFHFTFTADNEEQEAGIILSGLEIKDDEHLFSAVSLGKYSSIILISKMKESSEDKFVEFEEIA